MQFTRKSSIEVISSLKSLSVTQERKDTLNGEEEDVLLLLIGKLINLTAISTVYLASKITVNTSVIILPSTVVLIRPYTMIQTEGSLKLQFHA